MLLIFIYIFKTMIVEIILVVISTILTTIFTQTAMKALHLKSRCSECCDIEFDVEENNDSR